MCAEKFPLVSMGGQVESLTCADLGARTPLVNKKVLGGWARNDPKYENAKTVLKTECGKNASPCTFLFANFGPEGK
jgi:hypothetical protein